MAKEQGSGKRIKTNPLVAKLLEAGSELNGLLTQIKNQTDAESAAVWDAVRSDYSEAVDQFKASVDAHT